MQKRAALGVLGAAAPQVMKAHRTEVNWCGRHGQRQLAVIQTDRGHFLGYTQLRITQVSRQRGYFSECACGTAKEYFVFCQKDV